ncbi:MAG: hypothetical protein NTV80_19660 [Verrucomicrobia bacterium]|nr:hypothetical protein [Verrucomicrobiota bacterium]
MDKTHLFKFNRHQFQTILAAVLAVVVLSQCMSTVRHSYAPPTAEGSTARASKSRLLDERPGLGTQLGDEIHDTTTGVYFYRKPHSQPDAIATFHYNDKEGARLMAEMSGNAFKHGGDFTLIPGKLKVSVREVSWGYGTAFDYYSAGGKHFVIGQSGQRYVLQLENLMKHQIEVVTSIDGLDVLDGQPASSRKRGYVIPAKSTVTISGMRSGGKLRELTFGRVADSRAATAFGQTGARNVGVIGMACYEENESARRQVQVSESYLRDGARAFGN